MRADIRRIGWAAGLVIVVLATYANSLRGPFVFDDVPSITGNPTLRDFGWGVLAPPGEGGETVGGRPLVNLSLAFNYALGGLEPWGYHVVNVLIHASAALVVFGLVRRVWPGRVEEAEGAAWAVAAIWAVHPLQTESVTYVVQRAEALGGLAILAGLYATVRAAGATTPRGRRGWWVVAWGVAVAGMVTKETVVVLPVLAALLLRANGAAGWREVGRRHGAGLAALAATWGVLAWQVWGNAGRGGSVGWASADVAAYAWTQVGAVVRYLGLVFWPRPLVFDYGTGLVGGPGEVAWPAVALVLVLGGSVFLWVRRARLGYWALLWFVALAPSSSVAPVATQTVAEHRVYLALLGPVVLCVWAMYAWGGKRGRWLIPLVIVALGLATVWRNRDYASEVTLWADTVAKRPENPRAHLNLGSALARAGRSAEAVGPLRQALALCPDDPDAAFNLGSVLLDTERSAEAARVLEQFVRLRPGVADGHARLARAYQESGRGADAQSAWAEAVRLAPGDAVYRRRLGVSLMQSGQRERGLAELTRAVSLAPDLGEGYFSLGNALAEVRRYREAVTAYEAAVRRAPELVGAWVNLGNACAVLRDWAGAERAYREALRRNPDEPTARRNLDQVLARTGRR